MAVRGSTAEARRDVEEAVASRLAKRVVTMAHALVEAATTRDGGRRDERVGRRAREASEALWDRLAGDGWAVGNALSEDDADGARRTLRRQRERAVEAARATDRLWGLWRRPAVRDALVAYETTCDAALEAIDRFASAARDAREEREEREHVDAADDDACRRWLAAAAGTDPADVTRRQLRAFRGTPERARLVAALGATVGDGGEADADAA